MRQVERKAANKKRKARIWMLAVFALLLVAALLFLLLRKPVQVAPVPSTQRNNVVLLSVERDQLRKFTASPTHAPPYTFTWQDASFIPDGNPAFELDSNQLDVILGTLAHIEAADHFGKLELMPNETLEDFGLGSAAFTLAAEYADGQRIKLAIGNRVHGELPLDYMMVEGSDILYAISADIRDTFDRPMNNLHVVPAINFTPELVSRLTVKGQNPFIIRHLEHDLWVVEEPFHYPAEKAAVQQLLKQIGDMRLASFIAPATEQTQSEYGFDEDVVQVAFELLPSTITSVGAQGEVVASKEVDAQTVTFLFGNSIADTGWYCLYDGVIYQVSDLSMGFLMRDDWRMFASTNPIDIPLSTVRMLTVEKDGAEKAYRIALTEQVLPNNKLLMDELGDTLYSFLITQSGNEIAPEQVTQPYAKLMELRVRGRLPEDYQPNSPALLSIRIDAGTYGRDIAFYEYDALHVALSVDGKCLHYVDRSILDEIHF